MIRQRKKVSRKEIKEDKLVTFYYKAISALDKYKNQVMIGAAAVIVIVAAVMFYSYSQKSKNEAANLELSRMMQVYDSGDYQTAIDGKVNSKLLGFKKIVAQYGSTENGENAKIYLANSYYFLGNFDEAKKYYDDFSGSNELLKATSYAGLGGCFEAKKEYEKAASYFVKASGVAKDNVLNPKYLINAALDLMKANKNTEAKEYLTKVKRDYTKSPFSKDADRYLSLIN